MGHAPHLPVDHTVKKLLSGKLVDCSERTGHPFLRYKHTMKDILKLGDALHRWEDVVTERPKKQSCVSNILQKDRKKD